MNIALIGYGKMGKAIEKIAIERGHQITTIVNSENPIESADFSQVDVAIEFSIPALALHHIHFLLDNGIPCIVGTTGWHNHLDVVSKKANELKASFLHASNFSIGVNLFFKLNEQLAELMRAQPDYIVAMEEVHHLQKLDAPSGTAITLAQGIISNHSDYQDWKCPQNSEHQPATSGNSITINAVRLPDVPGTHNISYTSAVDTITISHQAHNRLGFASGAVVAAEWILGKTGVFAMRDVLNIK
jgi:4-hydroxy-tetrahydrodipicolinate reductase